MSAVANSPAEIAALTDYDALQQGQPLYMQAALVVQVDGRIDAPDFALRYTIEPFNHMHAWPVHRREGAVLIVGERRMRLNTYQLTTFELMEAMVAAGENVATRLTLWERLMEPLHAGRKTHVIVAGELANIRISRVAAFPSGAMTRIGKMLRPVAVEPGARWAMEPGRRYYLREAL